MKIARRILNKGNVELLRDIKKIKDIVSKLEKKHGVSSERLFRLLKGEIIIPVTIFRQEITILEAVVKYLKENLGYNFHEIGSLLARNERNIWHAYAGARKKHPGKLIVKGTDYFIPVSVIANRELSALEAVSIYLKDVYNLTYHEIALLLQRDDRTIWTVCSRAVAKVK